MRERKKVRERERAQDEENEKGKKGKIPVSRMPTTDDEECKWMLPMNESRPSEKPTEMILVASMTGTNEPAVFTRVIERLNSKKKERERTTSMNDYCGQ